MMYEPRFEFRPHLLFQGGHAQTLAGAYWPTKTTEYRATPRRIELPDGDVLIVHDDAPPDWKPGGRVALLLHGLVGCHLSGYMVRISSKLQARGVRTFRLDLRGCGAGAGLARKPYSAGCSDDVCAVVQFVEASCPGSAISMLGFSLSGNVLLKYLGESPSLVSSAIDRAVAVNPPVDLAECVLSLDRLSNRVYGRYFVNQLRKSVERLRLGQPDVEIPATYCKPRRLYAFDDQYTAPMVGYKNADEYYARCSAGQFLKNVEVPTLILTAQDDPLVPLKSFDGARMSEAITFHVADGGGHLGYIARRGNDPNRRWMDWRVVDWVCDAAVTLPHAAHTPVDR